jgi:hypothetical protein
MAILSTTPTTSWIEIQGRKIKVYDDMKTQSVNLCTPNNVEGDYEQVFYFRDKFRVTADQVDQYGNIPTLVSWLRKRSYDQLQ